MIYRYWMFAGEGRDQMVRVQNDLSDVPEDVRGEELVRATPEVAAQLAAVPADLRWQAAQTPAA